MRIRETLRTGLFWAMGVSLTVAFVGSLALHGDARTLVVAGFGLPAVWMPAGVCWLAVSRVGLRRKEILLAAVAVTLYTPGLTVLGLVATRGGSAPFPSPTGVGLLFYPLILAALVVAVSHHVRGLASSVWLDCAVGSLGVASVLAILLNTVLDSTTAGPRSLATVVAVAYPMLDLLLVAAVAGIAALRDVWLGHRWGLLVAGLLIFAAVDVIVALQRSADGYEAGTPLVLGWAIGLALVAAWVDGTTHREASTRQRTRLSTGTAALTVSTLATAAGLGVLVLSSRRPVPTLAVVLASVTLLAATARTHVAFRQLVWMGDLRRQATTDLLTGLPNRRSLYIEARARLLEQLNGRQALLMLDLNRFKDVNDSLGHDAGDQLLIQVGARLGEHLRASDVLARLGGDEFAVLLEDAGRYEAVDVAIKLRAALAEPFTLVDGITVHTSASIGLALFPDHGPDLSALLRKADIAMYRAKTSGDGHHVYSGTDDAVVATRLQAAEELRTALTTDQLLLHYQPKIDLDTGEVHGVEALVRWDHPTRGLLYPGAFLSLIDESGLMPSLNRVVLAMALDQVAAWRSQGQQLTVAVNLSASSLVDADLPNDVASMLAARGLSPHVLELEITEEFLMADPERARTMLTRLRRHGVQISIDDFGARYSSLSYLRDMPIDELKLDRSFVFPMIDDARAAALVASTIAMAHSLNLRLVAEGVDTDVAYTELVRLGCAQAQGYYMCRPVSAAELDHWLNERRATDKLTVIPAILPSVALD